MNSHSKLLTASLALLLCIFNVHAGDPPLHHNAFTSDQIELFRKFRETPQLQRLSISKEIAQYLPTCSLGTNIIFHADYANFVIDWELLKNQLGTPDEIVSNDDLTIATYRVGDASKRKILGSIDGPLPTKLYDALQIFISKGNVVHYFKTIVNVY
jgi:hypothetical protein